MDRGRHCGSVPEAIDEVVLQRAVFANRNPTRDGADVRMGRMDAAVDDRNPHPAA